MTVIQTSKNKALQAQVCMHSTWLTPGCRKLRSQNSSVSLTPLPWSSKTPCHWALLQLLLFSSLIFSSTFKFSFWKAFAGLGFQLCVAVSFETQSWKIITQCCWSCLSISKVTGCRHRYSAEHQAERHYFRCFREKPNCSQPGHRFNSRQTRL